MMDHGMAMGTSHQKIGRSTGDEEVCVGAKVLACCDQPTSRSNSDKDGVCQTLGCDREACPADPNDIPTREGVFVMPLGLGEDCIGLNQSACCDQPEGRSPALQKKVCAEFGCNWKACPGR